MQPMNDNETSGGDLVLPKSQITPDSLAEHGIHQSSSNAVNVRKRAENIAIGVSVAGGTAAATVGVIAAGTSATGAISAVGAVVGGVTGGVVGSSVGLVTGGAGIAATIPFAAAGTAIGGWAGPALALVGIGTAPAWAVPVAIGGGVIAIGGAVAAVYKFSKFRANRIAVESSRDDVER